MLRIIDRYVIRETVAPFLLALVVFTFVFQIPPLMEVAKELLEKGVDGWTILRILATLIPQALGITIPMSLLVGLLIGLGRLSGDREAVALQACGVSLLRLLRPVAVVALIGWALTMYVMLEMIPAGNRRYQEILHDLISAKVETQVKPRVFFEDFANLVLYARDVPLGGGGWKDLFLADSRQPDQPLILVARRGRMVMDRASQRVDLILEDGSQHRPDKDDPNKYRVEHFLKHILALDPNTVFPKSAATHGIQEMTIAELKVEIENARKQGISPHNYIMAIHQKYSIPMACAVFGLLALVLGVSNRKDGKQASFVIGIAVVFIYWALMYTGQSMAKAHWVAAEIAMWIPDIVLGAAGVFLLIWRHRVADSGLQITVPSWSSIRYRLFGGRPDTLPPPPHEFRVDDAGEVIPLRPAYGTVTPGTGSGPGFETAFRTGTGHDAGAGAASGATLAAAAGGSGPSARSTRANGRGGKTVLVIRVPQGLMPRFRILDSYVAHLYLQVFALAFLGMLLIFYIASFIDWSDKLFKGQATGLQLALFLWYSTPQYVYYLVPLSTLISTLITIGLLTKSSELIVMRACGISLYRVAVPLLTLGFMWGGAMFGLEETVLAQANRKAEDLKRIMRGGAPRTFDVMNRQWVAGKDGRLYHYAAFDPRTSALGDLSVYEFDDRLWRISRRTYAAQALYRNGTWEGQKGWIRAFDDFSGSTQYTPFAKRELHLEPVEYFRTEQPDAERMSFSDLRRYIGQLRTSGFDVVPYLVALHRKVSFPFVAVVMTLIGVPFAVTTGRRGALYGIGIGIFLAITYWGLFILFTAIGGAGMLTPALAAWAPNVLFLSIATYLLLTVRT
jgi:LPS export ABC transporter permease LptG/LPS export ABC transporter permease LptF